MCKNSFFLKVGIYVKQKSTKIENKENEIKYGKRKKIQDFKSSLDVFEKANFGGRMRNQGKGLGD